MKNSDILYSDGGMTSISILIIRTGLDRLSLEFLVDFSLFGSYFVVSRH